MSRFTNDFGQCSYCGANLEPVYFIEEETKIECGVLYKTGRKRRAVNYLVCPICLHKECVDDTFDGAWYHDHTHR